MADPVSLGLGALFLVSGIQKGQAAKASADAQSKAAYANAKLAQKQTEAQLDKADRERRLRLGANIAASGASGSVGGSALDVMASNVDQEALNLMTIETEGQFRRSQYEATGYNAKQQGYAGLTAGILGGASKGLGVLLQ